MTDLTRFDLDMDGSMDPADHGRWVRFDDASNALSRLSTELESAQKLLAEMVNLCAIGDIDENTDDGLGWAELVRDAKAIAAKAEAK